MSNFEQPILLSRNDIGQLLDGLDVLIEQWEATAEHLETGRSSDDECIREAHDAQEARDIAATYLQIRNRISEQINLKE